MSFDSRPLRLIHVSDVHFWRYAFNPLQLFSKRLLGMASLVARRRESSGWNELKKSLTGCFRSNPITFWSPAI